jgi:hypothetical protein
MHQMCETLSFVNSSSFKGCLLILWPLRLGLKASINSSIHHMNYFLYRIHFVVERRRVSVCEYNYVV